MQAVIGRIQLRRMTEWAVKRRENAEAIKEVCRQFPAVRVPRFACVGCSKNCTENITAGGCVHANYKCYVYLKPEMLAEGWSRNRIIDEITRKGVPCFQGSCSEIYLEKAFDGSGWRPKERLQIASKLGETSLMFLVHPTLTKNDIQKTCDVIAATLRAASGI